jgi:hypothetical protein
MLELLLQRKNIAKAHLTHGALLIQENHNVFNQTKCACYERVQITCGAGTTFSYATLEYALDYIAYERRRLYQLWIMFCEADSYALHLANPRFLTKLQGFGHSPICGLEPPNQTWDYRSSCIKCRLPSEDDHFSSSLNHSSYKFKI